MLNNCRRFLLPFNNNSAFNQIKYSYSEISQNINDFKEILLNKLIKSILIETKDYVVIDKPAGISLHREKPLVNLPYLGVCSKVTVEDLIPELCSQLKRPDNSLLISSELPWQYSGLVVLSKSKDHKEKCISFYRHNSYHSSHGVVTGVYRCLCWQVPHPSMASPAQFQFGIMRPSGAGHNEVAYKLNPGRHRQNPTSRQCWTKLIGHKLLMTDITGTPTQAITAPTCSIVDVSSNSTYRGLLPLYLLHTGCFVVGEALQASRLTGAGTGALNMIVGPDKADAGRLLPLRLRQKLGISTSDSPVQSCPSPLHIHRRVLLVPNISRRQKPLSVSADGISVKVTDCSIHWDSSARTNACVQYELPDHFHDSMTRLGLSTGLLRQLDEV